MTNSTQAFRDYATRISFNLSLSRNQVGHLAAIVMEIENEKELSKLTFYNRHERSKDTIIETGGRPNLFVVGNGSLVRMGLVEQDPRLIKQIAESEDGKHPRGHFWAYNGPHYRLTPAGEHIVELLRITGLIPKAAADTNKKRKVA